MKVNAMYISLSALKHSFITPECETRVKMGISTDEIVWLAFIDQ